MKLYFRTQREAGRFANALSRLDTGEVGICREEGLYRVQANGINQESGEALRALLEEGKRGDRITVQDVVNRREGIELTL